MLEKRPGDIEIPTEEWRARFPEILEGVGEGKSYFWTDENGRGNQMTPITNPDEISRLRDLIASGGPPVPLHPAT